MTDRSLLGPDGSALPLPPDPSSPVPDEVERALAAYRAGDVPGARALLTALAGAGRTASSGHAAMALAGLELREGGLDGACRTWLEQVAAGEDPWLGPLAAVMLTPAFKDYSSSTSGGVLLRNLAAQLTGDPATARTGFEEAVEVDDDAGTRAVACLLLGNLLLQSGEETEALKLLTDVRKMSGDVSADYARYLEGHVLIGQGKRDEAATVLQRAHRDSHPARGGEEGLYPWIALRFGELLAGDALGLDLVYDQVEAAGVSEGDVVREPFESAAYQKEISGPSLVDVGFNLFPADFEPVHAGLERLKTWSDERYERARRLVLALHVHVEDSRDEPRTGGLAELRAKLDLPEPR